MESGTGTGLGLPSTVCLFPSIPTFLALNPANNPLLTLPLPRHEDGDAQDPGPTTKAPILIGDRQHQHHHTTRPESHEP